VSGTLIIEGGPDGPDEQPDQSCPHNYRWKYACPTCNPVVGEHTAQNPN
jgi:hypothetical protein